MKPNWHYFRKSIENKEVLEERYMCLSKNKDIEQYRFAAEKIDAILEKIYIAKQHCANFPESLLEELRKTLDDDKSDKNRFNCFLNACDLTEETVKNDSNTLRTVVELFLKYRNVAASEPEEWIQALIDKGASRKMGKIGEQKLTDMAEKAGFIVVNNWDEMNKEEYAVARFSKGTFDLRHIRENIGAEMPFKMQEKMLDVILKNHDQYVFIEAKHIKESGGSQDKQIKELIDTISVDDKNQNISYAAFLDGLYSNTLIGDMVIENEKVVLPVEDKASKIISQKHDIAESLNLHERSYWLNTAGFDEFLKDFMNA